MANLANLRKTVMDLQARVIELEKSVAAIGKVLMEATKDLKKKEVDK